MSPAMDREKADGSYKSYNDFTLISSSDAHYVTDIGKRTTSFIMSAPTVKEMILALKNINGRKAEWR